jgi:nucleoside 2-deoxyribosyltransferase
MIRPAVEACGYECERSQGIAGNIIKLVLDDLNRADLVIADLTDRNPNVFYELGVRHALRDHTVLIAQTLDHVPFDLRPYSVIVYDWTTDSGRQEFAKKLRSALDQMKQRPSAATSPVREYLDVSSRQ